MEYCSKCQSNVLKKYQTLGIRLKMLRRVSNLTLKNVSAYVGISISQLSLIESNKRTPSIKVLLKFSTYYNISTDVLLKGTNG